MPTTVAEAQPAQKEERGKPSRQTIRWVAPCLLAAVICIVPHPSALTATAWYFFALFVGVVAGLILEPLPGAAVGFIGVSLACVLMLVGKTPAAAMKWGLAGFSNDTVWIIFAANLFAIGYEVTGLGRRLGLLLVKCLGKSTLGLGYALALSDLILAPFMPSVTARSGGTIYPLVKSIPPIFGSYPDHGARRIGTYLIWTSFSTCCVTSSMFLTSFAPNPLGVEIARKIAHVDISWKMWALGVLPVGAILFLLTPLIAFFVCSPEVKKSAEARTWAANELERLGKMSWQERLMALLAVGSLAAWIGATKWVAPTVVALAAISLMLLMRVISWEHILGAKQAWNVLIWFATLVAMAEGLNAVGFLNWVASLSAQLISNISATAALIVIVSIFFLVHYGFASGTAHTAAVLPVFLAAAVAIPGMAVRPVTLLMLYSMGLMGVISPYAIGPAPIFLSSGYVTPKDFWRLGFIMGAIYLIVLLAVGVPYLRIVMP